MKSGKILVGTSEMPRTDLGGPGKFVFEFMKIASESDFSNLSLDFIFKFNIFKSLKEIDSIVGIYKKNKDKNFKEFFKNMIKKIPYFYRLFYDIHWSKYENIIPRLNEYNPVNSKINLTESDIVLS